MVFTFDSCNSGGMRFGLLLLRYRAAEGLGVRYFANQLGIGYSTLSSVENGEEPSGRTLAAILRWMLGEKD